MTARAPRRPVDRPYSIHDVQQATGLSWTAIQKAAHLSGREFATYRERGMTERVADRVVCRLNLSPLEVWPATWLSLECAATDCPNRFHRGWRSRAIFCSSRCKSREHQRRKRAANPALLAREAERSAAYRAERSEAAKRAHRRYQREWAARRKAEQRTEQNEVAT